jgi:transposase
MVITTQTVQSVGWGVHTIGQGACLFSKRLERGRFIWPSPAASKVSLSSAQLAMLLEGLDWVRRYKPAGGRG